MRNLENNDFMILNNIIYKIYTTEDSRTMREQFIEQMKMVLDFDGADFYLAAEDGSKKLTEPITYNCDEYACAGDEALDSAHENMYGGKCMVYRETDLIPDEKRVRTTYYDKVYRPNNWHYSMQMILGRNKEFLGVVTFYRTIGKENFMQNDIFQLDILKEHIAYRLYKDRKEHIGTKEKLTITEATVKFHLTKREHTILKLLMEGKNNEQICEELVISVNTLKKHILNIYRKLGIKNRVQMFKMIREKE